MITNQFAEMFDVDAPIVPGGTKWVGRAELVAAVANAGALGMLTALTQQRPDDLRTEIDRFRRMIDRPIGANLTVLPTIRPMAYMNSTQAAVRHRAPHQA